MLRRILFIFLIAIEQLLKVKSLSPTEQSFSIATCPPNFTRVNNGCYLFNNQTTYTLATANSTCLREIGSMANFTNSTVHLLAFESLAEVTALSFWFKGNGFVNNFYIDGIASDDNRRYYSWSGHPLNGFNYLKTNFTKENYTMLFHNGSNNYEIRDTSATALMGFICEAQLPCPISNPNDTCRNGGKCYINAGKGLCVCPLGFEGASCEFQIDNCLSIPCKHGATCINLVNNYTCSCTKFYEGTHCDKEIFYKYESARLVVMTVSIALVGSLLLALSLMDLPWAKILEFFKCEKHDKKIKEKEEKKPKRELKNEKVDSRKIIASEQEMLNRFKSAMNNTRPKPSSAIIMPNQIAPESDI